MERRLVTIVCADVAGYSRLTGADEEGVIESLKAHRAALIDPTIASHGGRIVKTMGDGLLIVFTSPVEAVRCAIEVQQGMRARNEPIGESDRIQFRIGINLGDVVADSDDVLGDGVNIAARLEALSEIGGICVSRAVRDQVRDRLPIVFESMGEQTVRNIARPIHCYRVRFDRNGVRANPTRGTARPWIGRTLTIATLAALAGAGFFALNAGGRREAAPSLPAPAARSASAGARETASPRLSIVVLPFQTLGPTVIKTILPTELTDDITSDLLRIAGSFVISRNTAFTFKAKPTEGKAAAAALGVRYVLEGTVRRSGDQIRVNANLVDGETGAQIWSDRFEHDIRDVAAFQDEVTGKIVNSLGLELVAAEARRAQQAHTAPDTVDMSMRGWWLVRQPADRPRLVEARDTFERALASDPHSVPALLGKATALTLLVGLTWSDDPRSDLQRADDALSEVLALSPQNAAAYYVKCQLYFSRNQHREAIDACETSISLDRNYAPAYGFLAALSRLADQPERAVTLLRQAMALSPRDPNLWSWVQFLGRALSDLGHQDEAVESFRRAIAMNPGAPAFQWTLLSTAYARAKRPADARAAMDTFLKLSPQLMEGKPSETVRAMRVQIELALRGYYLGIIDGEIGRQSRRALAAFQRDQGIKVSEQPDTDTVALLGIREEGGAQPP